VVEISYRNTKFHGISSYFDITENTEINIRKTRTDFKLFKGTMFTDRR
jgi:hypothetical protein